MNNLGISFDGVHYRGADCGYCYFCGMPVRHAWVIHENKSGERITLCQRHYQEWELRRDMALEQVSADFRTALNNIRKA